MRLLILDQFSDPGGAQQVLLDLLPAIRTRGWQALVAMPGEGEMFARVRALGFDTAQLSCGPFTAGRKSPADAARLAAQVPALALQIHRLAAALPADLIYVNGPRLLPAAALARLRAPVLFHAHSHLPRGAAHNMAGVALRMPGAHVVGICEFVAEPWRRWVPPERISVVYNGVAEPPPVPPAPARHAPAIGCIGRIAPEKGQREFVAAAAVISRSLPECRFVVHGAPLFSERNAARYFDEVRTAAAGLPIEFAGWSTDIHAALAHLDLLLVPSGPNEATTRVIPEAFAAGVPVIAFRSGGIPEIVTDQRTGLLAASSEEMARLAIELVTGDPQRIAGIRQNAQDTWRQRFTLEEFQGRIMEVIERQAGRAEAVTASEYCRQN